MDRRLIGTSLLVVLLGVLLLCFTEGGVFNPVIPWPQGAVGLPAVYHPEGAHIDLTRSGPRAGLLALLAGTSGLVYAYAKRAD